MKKFKLEYSLDQRISESSSALFKIPVICEKNENSKLQDIDRKKYLVPINLSCGQFMQLIRKRLHLPEERILCLLCNFKAFPSTMLVKEVYDKNKDIDGFLYATYLEESILKESSFERRFNESTKLLLKYPDCVPVICERKESSTLPDLNTKKYLLPVDSTFGQFVDLLRMRLQLTADTPLHLVLEDKPLQLPTSTSLKELYAAHKNTDGLLHLSYTDKLSWGMRWNQYFFYKSEFDSFVYLFLSICALFELISLVRGH